jgi:hypothetical protein
LVNKNILFEEAKRSITHTYLRSCQHIDCDTDDQLQSIRVLSDQAGIAKVNFYIGNADNFTYHARATIGQGASVDFSIKSRTNTVSQAFG